MQFGADQKEQHNVKMGSGCVFVVVGAHVRVFTPINGQTLLEHQ